MMTSAIDLAIEKIRALPKEQQEYLADILLEYTESGTHLALTSAQLNEVHKRLKNPNPSYTTLAEVVTKLGRKFA